MDVRIALEQIPLEFDGTAPSAVSAFGTTYFLFHSPFAKCAAHFLSLDVAARTRSAVSWLLLSIAERLMSGKARKFTLSVVDRYLSSISDSTGYDSADLRGIDFGPLYAIFDEETWRGFDPLSLDQKGSDCRNPFLEDAKPT